MLKLGGLRLVIRLPELRRTQGTQGLRKSKGVEVVKVCGSKLVEWGRPAVEACRRACGLLRDIEGRGIERQAKKAVNAVKAWGGSTDLLSHGCRG